MPSLDFMADYFKQTGSGKEQLWKKYVKAQLSWQKIHTYEKQEYRDTLIEAWLQYCEPSDITDEICEWLNGNLGFCVERLGSIGVEHLKEIINGCLFNNISALGPIGGQHQGEDVMDLANYILANRLFELTDNNIFVACEISSSPFIERKGADYITISDILSSENNGFEEYVLENIQEVFTDIICKSKGQETESGLVFILNQEDIEEPQKIDYLKCQTQDKVLDIAPFGKGNGYIFYGSGSDVVSQDAASDSESDSESETESDIESDTEMISGDGRSLKEIFGDNITVDETFSVGGITADINVNYKVPEVSQINVYEGSFIKNDSDIEKRIVNNFFGGTEKNLDEIKYENDSDYIPLLYKYRSILMYQNLGISAYSAEAVSPADADEYLSVIDSSFDKVYNWVDEVNYYIHMYEGEYNGNRYGMIYYYDMANSKRNIYISPISMTEYFPDFDAKTIFVVDQKSDFGSDNLCSMSEADVAKEAGDVVEKLGLNMKDIILSTNPNMAEPQVGMTGTFPEDNNAEMPKLVFSDSNMMSSIQKLNSTNPTGRTYAYKLLKEQQNEQVQADSVNFSVNGYSIYLCSAPFSENVMPQPLSSFNRDFIRWILL